MKRVAPLLFVMLGFAVLGTIWIVTDRRASQRVYDRYSSANTSDKGMSLAFGYLGKTRKVAMLTRPLGREPLERNAVVFRVAEELPLLFDPEMVEEKQAGPPKPKLRPLLTTDDERFIREGGRLVIAAGSGALETMPLKSDVAVKVFPIWPALGNIKLDDESAGFLTLRPRMHAILISDSRTVLARERIGAGELFVLSTPGALSNASIENNLALVAGLAGDRRPVYFDEVIHGLVRGQGSLALMKEWNLGPFLILAAACTALVFWRAGRRIGPPEDDHRDTRSDAVDLVRSLGALYENVTSDAEAVTLYHDALTRTVANNSGLRGEALHKRVEALTGGFTAPKGSGKMPRHAFDRALAALNEGFGNAESHRGKSA
ncbi:MAG TPA: hypothetical protein VEK57_02135 [Thermoanaerobaculia bacterium]|nr:hypothetical protein [Thermoanaerobaculia bacterium]